MIQSKNLSSILEKLDDNSMSLKKNFSPSDFPCPQFSFKIGQIQSWSRLILWKGNARSVGNSPTTSRALSSTKKHYVSQRKCKRLQGRRHPEGNVCFTPSLPKASSDLSVLDGKFSSFCLIITWRLAGLCVVIPEASPTTAISEWSKVIQFDVGLLPNQHTPLHSLLFEKRVLDNLWAF